MPKSASLSDQDLFAIAHLSSNLPSDLDIDRLRETTTSAAKFSLAGFHRSGVAPTSDHYLPCSASSPSGPTTTGGSVISQKAGRRARPISVAKAHRVENTVQSFLFCFSSYASFFKYNKDKLEKQIKGKENKILEKKTYLR